MSTTGSTVFLFLKTKLISDINLQLLVGLQTIITIQNLYPCNGFVYLAILEM